jgi:hypothetical protein
MRLLILILANVGLRLYSSLLTLYLIVRPYRVAVLMAIVATAVLIGAGAAVRPQ